MHEMQRPELYRLLSIIA